MPILRKNRMNKTNAATILVISGLIGYLLLRFSLPALQTERLIFLAGLSIIGLVLMFMYRREKHKPAYWISFQASATKLVSAQCHPLFSATCSPNSFSKHLLILRILSAYWWRVTLKCSSLAARFFGKHYYPVLFAFQNWEVREVRSSNSERKRVNQNSFKTYGWWHQPKRHILVLSLSAMSPLHGVVGRPRYW